MNANTIPSVFNFSTDSQVRVVQVDGSPWFVSKDIAEALDYTWSGSRIAHVPEQWRGMTSVVTPSGTQQMSVLSEQGLYFFLGRSDKPKALPLQMYVAGEVLPSIRKTGGYSVQPKPEPVKLLPANPDVLSTFFGALRAYVGASSAKAPLWIGVSEHVFSELGITDLNGLNDDNIGQAIRAIIADVNGANIGAMRSDYYRIG